MVEASTAADFARCCAPCPAGPVPAAALSKAAQPGTAPGTAAAGPGPGAAVRALLCVPPCPGLTWKNDVCEGSMPVPPAGMKTSLGASRPTRAGAPTLYLLISSLIYSREDAGERQARVGSNRYTESNSISDMQLRDLLHQ
jgi:hypothetical protein